jgi:TolB-like protein/predicted Zn-dependent protease
LDVGSSAPRGAVFLSYASQDAEAAKRICEALRASGVEVWFDQSELRGGDAWDALIRKRIKECALFVPVITPNTNARAEGYFRLEWKLAVDRSHLMADDAPFLFPVVLGDVTDATARVPDKFREVQWTRLRLDETPAELASRVARLLAGHPVEAAAVRPTERASPVPNSAKKAPWLRNASIAMGLVIGLIYALRPLWAPAPAAPPKPAVAAPAVSEAADLAARAYAISQKVGFTREDLATAEALAQRAVALEPASARGQSVRAWVLACYLMRNWDISDRRMQEVQAAANGALALDPNSADALNALASVFDKQRLPAEVERISRRAIAAEPGNYRSHCLLGRALRGLGRKDEALQVLGDAVRRFPDNVLCRYELAVSIASIGMMVEDLTPARTTAAIEQLDAAIAVQPFSSAVLVKAVLAVAGRGDFALMRAELDRLETFPVSDRTEDRAVFMAMWAGLLERRPERVIAAAKLTTRPYFEDLIVAGPRAWYTAFAYHLAGKEALATQEWRAAETTLRQRLREQPGDMDTVKLAVTLAWQGDGAGANQLLAPIEAVWREDMSRQRARELARYYAALGDADKAVPYLRQVINYNSFLTDYLLPLDPWWDKLRGQPAFEAFLHEAPSRGLVPAKPEAVAPAADSKSVAVLAFANLSDDKANEYFSDGISEELLNVLAKVPGLKVSARTSAFSFKGKDVPVPEIARQLGVAYVVEGSVRKSGDKVRITAQLIKAADGFHVWSDTFTRDLKDIFAVQDEIAGLIARNLELKLRLAAESAPVNPDAFALFLQGRFFARQESNPGRKQAIDFYRRALQLEPRYALAWAEMAQAYVRLARFGGMPTAEGMREARAAAQSSLAIDPDQPVALDALGWVQRTADWDWKSAQKTFDRALSLAPEDAAILTGASILYFNVGRTEEALELARKAVDRDPLNAMAHINYGDLLINCGRLDAGVPILRQGLTLAPGAEEFSTHLAIALEVLKRPAEADAAIEREPSESYRLWGRGMVAALRNDLAGAARAREALMARNDPSMGGYVAMLYGAEKKLDEAFAWMDRTFRERDSTVCWIKANAVFYRNLIGDPRWTDFVRRAGLAPEQLK